MMNSADWITATGSALVRGGPSGFRRPVNPQLLAAAVGKSHKPAAATSRPKHDRAWRAARLAIAQATAPIETPRTSARGVAQWELNQPGAAGARAYERHVAVLQRSHGIR
jgi:hypothetical protein